MQILEILENKKKYLDLLLLADEQEDMIDRYLDRGRLFILDDDGVKSECLVTDEKNGVLEIKNLATYPDFQGRGYGKALIRLSESTFRGNYVLLQVGTGDSQKTIGFYEKCGFVQSHRVKDFFLDNYTKPIYEEGVLLKDMVYLKKPL